MIRSLTIIAMLSCATAFVAKRSSFYQPASCPRQQFVGLYSGTTSRQGTNSVDSASEATRILSTWDRNTNPEAVSKGTEEFDRESFLSSIPDAVRFLNEAARKEREQDSTKGRVMLGICAGSADEGLATLKSWVGALELPRGLLHGMDKDGVPLDLDGAVYLKYNTGGSLTFSDIRKSGMGFDAIWKPGDVLLELYDGTYRGVYFQVELADGVFRQFLVPLNIFD